MILYHGSTNLNFVFTVYFEIVGIICEVDRIKSRIHQGLLVQLFLHNEIIRIV